jgi:hypothetical protein
MGIVAVSVFILLWVLFIGGIWAIVRTRSTKKNEEA